MDRRKVMIVDDDQVAVLALSQLLRKHGYDTVAAMDASTASTIARREMPDLIILDMGLPGGHGLQVLRTMRTLGPLSCTPVIVLTASDESMEREVLAAGADAFFQKPPAPDTFLAAVKRALGE